MILELYYTDVCIGRIRENDPADLRPGDYLAIRAQDDEEGLVKELLYRVVRKTYHCVATSNKISISGHGGLTKLSIDPANHDAYMHLQSVMAHHLSQLRAEEDE